MKSFDDHDERFCPIKWIRLTHDETHEYGYNFAVPCKCGKWKVLYGVHNEIGDYQCPRCSGSINLSYYCFECKHHEAS
jgi:hypothetical protein